MTNQKFNVFTLNTYDFSNSYSPLYFTWQTKLPDLNLMQCIISGNAIECHKKMVMVFLLRHLRSPYALNEFLNSPTFEDMASVLVSIFIHCN